MSDIRQMIGEYTLPKMSGKHSIYCMNGCGDCGVVTSEDYTYRETSYSGVLLKELYYKYPTSSCCGGDIGIWDNESDSDSQLELEFIESK